MALLAMVLQFYLSSATLAGYLTDFSAADDRVVGWVACDGQFRYQYDSKQLSAKVDRRYITCMVCRPNVLDDVAVDGPNGRNFHVTAFYANIPAPAVASDRVLGNRVGVGSSRSPPLV